MALINCSECGKQISDKASVCPSCGAPVNPVNEEIVCCPRCRSTQLSANKKGYSGTKAFLGAITVGSLGLLAGTQGSNDVILTCMACGNQFKPNEGNKTTKDKLSIKGRPCEGAMEMLFKGEYFKAVVAQRDAGMQLHEAKDMIDKCIPHLEDFMTEQEKSEKDITTIKNEFLKRSQNSGCVLLLLLALSPLLAFIFI